MKNRSDVYLIDGDYEILKFKDRNIRLVKIWAAVMGVEMLILGSFCFVLYRLITLSHLWC